MNSLIFYLILFLVQNIHDRPAHAEIAQVLFYFFNALKESLKWLNEPEKHTVIPCPVWHLFLCYELLLEPIFFYIFEITVIKNKNLPSNL